MELSDATLNCPRCGRKIRVNPRGRFGHSSCTGAVHANDTASNYPFCGNLWPGDYLEAHNRERLTCLACKVLLAPGTPCDDDAACTRVKACGVHADTDLQRRTED